MTGDEVRALRESGATLADLGVRSPELMAAIIVDPEVRFEVSMMVPEHALLDAMHERGARSGDSA